jgi:parvulin-like peptidyl-prolyl isomerase
MGKTPHRPEKALTRKQISRREREQRLRQRLITGTSVVLLLIVAILGWGLYDQYVLQPRRPVATVYGTEIPLAEYQRLVRYRRWDYRSYLEQLQAQRQQLGAAEDDQAFLLQYIDQQIQQLQSELMNLPISVLDEMIDDRIIRRESAQRGITVTADEVQLRLEEQFGYERNPVEPTPEPTSALPDVATPDVATTGPLTATATPAPTPTPTVAPMTQEQFVERSTAWYEAVREATGLTEADLRYLMEGSLYRTKLSDAIRAEAPTTAEQVHARHILVATREEAESIVARLEAGEDFAALAAQLSQDTSNKDDGGDLGWFPRGQMVESFAEAAFALQPGETSDVVETEFGFHVVRVEEREADRPLESAALQSAQDQAWEDWLAAQRLSDQVIRQWSSTMVPEDLPTPRPDQ